MKKKAKPLGPTVDAKPRPPGPDLPAWYALSDHELGEFLDKIYEARSTAEQQLARERLAPHNDGSPYSPDSNLGVLAVSSRGGGIKRDLQRLNDTAEAVGVDLKVVLNSPRAERAYRLASLLRRRLGVPPVSPARPASSDPRSTVRPTVDLTTLSGSSMAIGKACQEFIAITKLALKDIHRAIEEMEYATHDRFPRRNQPDLLCAAAFIIGVEGNAQRVWQEGLYQPEIDVGLVRSGLLPSEAFAPPLPDHLFTLPDDAVTDANRLVGTSPGFHVHESVDTTWLCRVPLRQGTLILAIGWRLSRPTKTATPPSPHLSGTRRLLAALLRQLRPCADTLAAWCDASDIQVPSEGALFTTDDLHHLSEATLPLLQAVSRYESITAIKQSVGNIARVSGAHSTFVHFVVPIRDGTGGNPPRLFIDSSRCAIVERSMDGSPPRVTLSKSVKDDSEVLRRAGEKVLVFGPGGHRDSEGNAFEGEPLKSLVPEWDGLVPSSSSAQATLVGSDLLIEKGQDNHTVADDVGISRIPTKSTPCRTSKATARAENQSEFALTLDAWGVFSGRRVAGLGVVNIEHLESLFFTNPVVARLQLASDWIASILDAAGSISGQRAHPAVLEKLEELLSPDVLKRRPESCEWLEAAMELALSPECGLSPDIAWFDVLGSQGARISSLRWNKVGELQFMHLNDRGLPANATLEHAAMWSFFTQSDNTNFGPQGLKNLTTEGRANYQIIQNESWPHVSRELARVRLDQLVNDPHRVARFTTLRAPQVWQAVPDGWSLRVIPSATVAAVPIRSPRRDVAQAMLYMSWVHPNTFALKQDSFDTLNPFLLALAARLALVGASRTDR